MLNINLHYYKNLFTKFEDAEEESSWSSPSESPVDPSRPPLLPALPWSNDYNNENTN